MSPFQQKCYDAIKKYGHMDNLSTTEIASLVKSNRLAVYSAMRSLESQGLARQWVYTGYGTENQTGCQMWKVGSRQPRKVER